MYAVGQEVEIDTPGRIGIYDWQKATIVRYVPWTKDAPQWPSGWIVRAADNFGNEYEVFAETNRMRPTN